MNQSQNQFSNLDDNENPWQSIYILGGVTTIIALNRHIT
jgi:hypothetical protein